MLAMGRALMSQPKLLMLDEPSMGLSPIMMQKIMATIAELKADGTTILLVEQNAQAALSLAIRDTSWRSATSSSPAPDRTCCTTKLM